MTKTQIPPLRILIVSDAWSPQINGVVVTLRNTVRELTRMGHDIATLTPNGFRTAYHTQFPEYIHARTRLPVALTYRWMRWFHAPARTLMVATAGIRRRLAERGFKNLAMWSRGVDTQLFRPGYRTGEVVRPIFLYAGRIAVEKNIEAFLALDLPGTKWVVGDGPARLDLQRRFPKAVFFGMKTGEDLAWHYRQSDVFVFPSRTDTFGLVMLEAMASGTPVAAFPVTGPIDVVRPGTSGALDHDLAKAALAALDLPRDRVRAHAMESSWERCTAQFLANLHPVNA